MTTQLGSTNPPKVTLPDGIPGANVMAIYLDIMNQGLGVTLFNSVAVDSVTSANKVISNPVSVVVYNANNEPIAVSGLTTPIQLDVSVTEGTTLTADSVIA